MTKTRKLNTRGFTIIELMIATSVFSVVLVVAASGILTIGRTYYKTITSSRTQEATRTIINTISETIQFTAQSRADDGTVDTVGVPQAICFGYDRYTYVIDSRVDDGVPGIAYDQRPDLDECLPSTGGTELLPDNMTLLSLRVNAINSSNFRIAVKVGYGDHDLQALTQCSGSIVGGICQNPSIDDISTAICRGGIAGSDFCAISELETTINKRVE